MIRYLPVLLEVVGLAAFVAGAALFNPAFGLAAGGAVLVVVGYVFEEPK